MALPTTIAVVMLLVWHIQMIAANKTTIEHAEVSWVAVINRDGRLVTAAPHPLTCRLWLACYAWCFPYGRHQHDIAHEAVHAVYVVFPVFGGRSSTCMFLRYRQKEYCIAMQEEADWH